MCFCHLHQLDVEVGLTISDVDPADYACVILEVLFCFLACCVGVQVG